MSAALVPRSVFHVSRFVFWFGFAVLTAATVHGQAPRSSPPPPALPQTFFSGDLPIRVVPVATGLSHPWSLAFLPDGSLLVTEREGRLRIIRNGVLDPTASGRRPARVRAGARRTARRRAASRVRREPLRVSELLEGGRQQSLHHCAGPRPLRRLRAHRREGDLRRQHLEQIEHELRRPHRLRSSRPPVSDRRRAAGTGSRAERRRPRREGASSARRRERAARQSVRRHARATSRRSTRSVTAARRAWR